MLVAGWRIKRCTDETAIGKPKRHRGTEGQRLRRRACTVKPSPYSWGRIPIPPASVSDHGDAGRKMLAELHPMEAIRRLVEMVFILLGFHRTGGVDEDSAGCEEIGGRADHRPLLLSRSSNGLRIEPPLELGVSPKGPGAGARGIEKHEIPCPSCESGPGCVSDHHQNPVEPTVEPYGFGKAPVAGDKHTPNHPSPASARSCRRRGTEIGGSTTATGRPHRDPGHQLRARVLDHRSTIDSPHQP